MPTDASLSLQVSGLNEALRALRGVNPKLPRAIGQAGKAAAEIVADGGRSEASSQGGVAAKSTPAIKAGAQRGGGVVRLDGRAYPWALGAEFGAKKFPQFKPWRGNEGAEPGGLPGYFVYPTIRDEGIRQRVADAYDAGVAAVMREAFPQ